MKIELYSQKSKQEQIAYINAFQLYYKELVFFASRVVKSDFIAEDLVQDAFIKLFEQRVSLENETFFKTYLFRMVKNGCLDYLKHQKAIERYNQTNKEEVSEELILESIAEAEVMSIILAKLDELPTECRKIMLLTLDGYSTEEIAQMQGLAQSTIRAQKRRGLGILRDKLPGELFLFILMIFDSNS